MADPTTEVPGHAIAEAVLDGFFAYRERFADITRGASERFERAAWLDAQRASIERIGCYSHGVTRVADAIARDEAPDLESWRAARSAYAGLCAELPEWELAETFFNSVYCRLRDHADIRNENLFVRPASAEHSPASFDDLFRVYPLGPGGWPDVMRTILHDYAFALPWEDLERDIRLLLCAIEAELPVEGAAGEVRIELVKPAFFRNKGAYLVGRIVSEQGVHPLAMAILNDEAGHVYVDNLILAPDELSIVFSFTRSYFMVDAADPPRLVRFLHTLLPAKKRFELYTSIGLNRHGKTELYRDLLDHLDQSSDPFVTAPGIRGMVMAVFTLPSYQTVFKIIKDRFPPQKDVTRDQVMAAYRLVKMHDRVGRMADTQEFSNLRLPRDRFDPELLRELLEVAAASVSIDGDEVLIRHCYTERQMTPLNIYIEQVEEPDLIQVLDEYGNAIRQLAAANIFPGDMLLKNFGVTRHGRVVFYDYDEICYLTDVNFRAIPEPRTPEEEMASEPWYSVGPMDVFPEEFPRFLFANRRIKTLFTQLHGEIFDPTYWQGLQRAIHDGQVMDVFPYRRSRRLLARFDASDADPRGAHR